MAETRLDYTTADAITAQINELKMHALKTFQTDDDILQKIREICKGLALSERARAMRYDKIVEILREEK